MLLAVAMIMGLAVMLIVYGLSRAPQTNTAEMVQQRLQVYRGQHAEGQADHR